MARKNPTISGTSVNMTPPVEGIDNLPLPSGANVALKEKANAMPEVSMKANDGDQKDVATPAFATGKDGREYRKVGGADATPAMPGA